MSTNIDRIVKEAAKNRKKSTGKIRTIEVEQIFGPEPVWESIKNTDESFDAKFSQALNWYNAAYDNDEFKQEVIKYLTSKNLPVGNLESLPSWKFSTVGKIACLLNRGCPLRDTSLHKFNQTIKSLQNNDLINPIISEIPDNNEITEDNQIVAKQKKADIKEIKMSNKVNELLGSISDQIDGSIISGNQLDESDVYHRFIADKTSEKIVDQIHERLIHQFKGFEQELRTLEKLDELTIKEQFDSEENYNKYLQNIKSNLENLLNVTNQIGSYLGNKKAIKKSSRRGRKAKIRNVEDQISKLNFKVQDSEYKLMSIDPNSIVGAQTLLVFNTENRKLGIYVALDHRGILVKGTTLYNYDEARSIQKTLRKPEILTQFQEGNIRRIFVLLKEHVHAKNQPLNGRINKHTILLRVLKDQFPVE